MNETEIKKLSETERGDLGGSRRGRKRHRRGSRRLLERTAGDALVLCLFRGIRSRGLCRSPGTPVWKMESPAVGSVGLAKLPRLSDVLINYLLMRCLQNSVVSITCDYRC